MTSQDMFLDAYRGGAPVNATMRERLEVIVERLCAESLEVRLGELEVQGDRALVFYGSHFYVRFYVEDDGTTIHTTYTPGDRPREVYQFEMMASDCEAVMLILRTLKAELEK